MYTCAWDVSLFLMLCPYTCAWDVFSNTLYICAWDVFLLLILSVHMCFLMLYQYSLFLMLCPYTCSWDVFSFLMLCLYICAWDVSSFSLALYIYTRDWNVPFFICCMNIVIIYVDRNLYKYICVSSYKL